MSLMLLTCSLHANLSEDTKKNIQKEAHEAAQDYNNTAWNALKALYKNGSDSIMKSLSDDPPLNPDEVKARCKSQEFPQTTPEMKELLISSREFDIELSLPDEKYKLQEEDIDLNALGSEQQKIDRFETCEEGEVYTYSFEQERQVSITPAIKKVEKICLGHKKEFSAWTRNGLKEDLELFKKHLEDEEGRVDFDFYIDSSFVNLVTSYCTTAHWKHLEPEKRCHNYHTHESIIQQAKETESWKTLSSNRRSLSEIEGNPSCSLLQVENYEEGPRLIDEMVISKPFWKRRLIFNCREKASSKCEKLRLKGGILVEKQCLKQHDDRCALWQKTYDMSSLVEPKNHPTVEIDHDLFIGVEADKTFGENTDFGEAIATLMAAAGLADQEDPKNINFTKESIFSGCESKCRRSFDSDNVFDCCYDGSKQGQGLCIAAHLGKCSEEEKGLYRAVRDGKCHYLGKLSGTLVTKHIYCCFPTKLARILQEEGRKQLGLSWGNSKKSRCHGLSFQQLTSLDFSQMDLSEFVRDFKEKVSEEALAKKLKHSLQEFSGKISLEETTHKTRNILSEDLKKVEEAKP
ncbi:conjugal transfer protein TraN [Simkania negevensis]|nr:conjugal transfer protein TraN [Simkania negevensis]